VPGQIDQHAQPVFRRWRRDVHRSCG
jgi:hypothetical protein